MPRKNQYNPASEIILRPSAFFLTNLGYSTDVFDLEQVLIQQVYIQRAVRPQGEPYAGSWVPSCRPVDGGRILNRDQLCLLQIEHFLQEVLGPIRRVKLEDCQRCHYEKSAVKKVGGRTGSSNSATENISDG